jgi:hypothetical protein
VRLVFPKDESRWRSNLSRVIARPVFFYQEATMKHCIYCGGGKPEHCDYTKFTGCFKARRMTGDPHYGHVGTMWIETSRWLRGWFRFTSVFRNRR